MSALCMPAPYREQPVATLRTSDFVWAAGIAGVWTALLALFPPTFYTGLDYPRFFEPYAVFLRENLLQGQLPWWNPHASLGRPFLADLQSFALYPVTLLNLVFGVTIGMAMATWIHGALALLGFARLIRSHHAHGIAIWVGGTILLFSAPWLARMQAGSINLVFGLCYLPLVLDLSRRLVREPNRRTLTSLALVWALQLASGHPQAFWISVMGASAYILGFAPTGPWRGAAVTLGRSWGLMVLAGISALGLMGLGLVPLAGMVAESNRAESSMEFSALFAIAPNQWFSLVLAPSREFAANWEYDTRIGFVGLLGGVLALRRWRDPSVRGLITMGVFGGLIAAGESTPVFGWLYHVLPGLSGFRIPARAGVLIVLALAIAATVLAGRIHTKNAPGSPATRLPYLVSGGTLLVSLVAYFAPQASLGWLVTQAGLVLITTLGWYALLERHRKTGAGILIGIVVVDLTMTLVGQKSLPEAPTLFKRYDVEEMVVAALEAKDLHRQPAPPRVSIRWELLRENSGMVHGFSTATGFESLTLDRVWTYLHRAAGVDPDHAFNTSPPDSIYFATDQLGSLSLNISLPRDGVVLRINELPDPRAFVVGQAARVEHWVDAVDAMVAGHPIHEVALVESGMAPNLDLDPDATQGSARITGFSLNQIQVEVTSPGPGILVLKEAWYPGWSASVNGIDQKCFPVNGWMRGVAIPAGASQVELRYRQEGVTTGAAISVLTAATLGWLRWRRASISEHASSEA